MITFVNAADINIISGSNYTFQLDTTLELQWRVEGNSSNMDGFDIIQEIYSDYSDITIITHPMYKPDNFTLILFDNEGEIVIEYHSHSGGGSCTYDTDFNWECSTWGTCEERNQTRTCKPYNNCHNTYGKPNETQSCEEEVVGGETDEHGCQLTAGYTWCENKQKCLREWEEKCEDEDEVEVEKDYTLIYIIIIILIIIILGIIWWVSIKRNFRTYKNETKN